MFSNYIEVRDWLESYIPLVYGKGELGLARIENLLSKLGDPQKSYRSILVGGTAGKGSTAFYISRLLQVKGQKVGLHISPHLIYIGERMQINGRAIPVGRLVGLVTEIKPVIDEIIAKQPHLTPSYFEILVALSFLYFAKEKVDIAVVEVGLGGRLDATNILENEISVITNVGLDHTELLGDSVEKIASEKAGIIKENKIVITGVTGKALKVIENVAKIKHSTLIKLSTLSTKIKPKSDIEKYVFSHYYRLRSNARSFAVFNKNLALLAVLVLEIELTENDVKKAFSGEFVGRFEEIDDGVIVDGAHNVDKIMALIDFIREYQVSSIKYQVVLVLAFKKGKNWKEMVDLLVKKLPDTKIIATQYFATTDMGKGSAVEPEEIAAYIESSKYLVSSIKVISNSQEAVFGAVSDSYSSSEGNESRSSIKEKFSVNSNNNLVVVTGSLYLVGEARTLWKLPEF